MGAEVTLASQGGRVTLGARTMEEEEGDNRGYFYDSDRCGRNSDAPFSSDEEVDGLNDGADTPSKFAPRSSSKHMTELNWASFGAAEAGLGAEVLNVNEHGACVTSSSTSWFGDMRDSLSKDQIESVAAALFSDSPPLPRDHSNSGSKRLPRGLVQLHGSNRAAVAVDHARRRRAGGRGWCAVRRRGPS